MRIVGEAPAGIRDARREFDFRLDRLTNAAGEFERHGDYAHLHAAALELETALGGLVRSVVETREGPARRAAWRGR
jgi:hypothetical protein